ncbi:MAG TPA: hypothetical protein VMY18_11795 [Acidobacteriota bacterium]|nr:hypothetical protein [Acidobacteriota bacterium]
MNRIHPEPKNEAMQALGDAPEEEYTFLLVPVGVYSLVSQLARKEGCSVGEVFQRSLLQYLRAVESAEGRVPDQRADRPAPDIAVRRKRSP